MTPSRRKLRDAGVRRLAGVAVCIVLAASAVADDGPQELPPSQRSTGDDAAMLAPLGITDARSLSKGEWALSYRYSWIHQDDMRDNTHRESTSDLLQIYDETPRRRDTHVHLFGVSYAPHRRVTLSVKLPVFSQETKVVSDVSGPVQRFSTDSSGLGDLELRVLVPFMRNRNESLQVEMGITAPTGSISERDRGARLSLPQQGGSGTVDLLPGMVYRGRWNTLSWGFVGRAKFRVYKNRKDTRLGDEFLLSAWLAQSWTDWMSTSLRLSWQRRDNAHSDETILNPPSNPERDPKRQAGDFLDLGPGANFRIPFLGEPRFGVEMTWPFYQNLKGPQLERDWQLSAGWQWAF